MPDPITYAEAAALAQRLDRAREQGALLLLDGKRAVTGFEFNPDIGRIVIDAYGGWECFFLTPEDKRFRPNAFERMTPAEFEAHWQGRITLHGRLPWPTEAETGENAGG